MKKLLIYLKDYKKESIIAPLFKMLEASFELFIPLVIASIVDNGITKNNSAHIFLMGGLLLLLAIIGLGCAITAQYFAAKAAIGFGTALRCDAFHQINSYSYTELDSFGTSTLITRMTSDINQVQAGVNMVLRLFLRSPFIVFGAMIMAFTVDVPSAFIFVVTVPLLSLIIFGILLLTMPIYKKIQGHLDQVLLSTRENLIGARVIRAFHSEEQEIQDFEETSSILYNTQMLVGKISSLMNPATYVVVNVATIVILQVGGHKVFDGILSQGEVLALVNYMAQILVELIKLANLIISIPKSLACADRISEILSTESSMDDGNEELSTIHSIQFNDVSFHYKNSPENTLSNLSFSVNQGQTVGIIGATGSGKSTLVHLLARFYDASNGEILINHKNIKEYSIEQLRKHIGIVPQKAVLFKGTIRENLKFGNEHATDEELYNALALAQAKEIVDKKPEKLDTMIEQNGRNLSGGQRQRFTIARALVKNPDILILDDSSSALDLATDANLRKAMSTLTDTTIFVVSQRVSTVQNSDLILVLEDGKLAGSGTHLELLSNCNAYKDICYSQMSKEEVNRHA
ncbi:Lipid A export ATP-binding/permease protein MsbA [Lachnospiraceae bacterium TWA4]|nr:Lipid A export ATP-binding/permease protein MsbA [Lachnospiraceae bacterium TWA4]